MQKRCPACYSQGSRQAWAYFSFIYIAEVLNMTSPLSGLGLKHQPLRGHNTTQGSKLGIEDLSRESLRKLYFIAKNGGDISSAIPDLVTSLQSPYFNRQSVAAQVLEVFARNGGDITVAIPTLAEDFSHTHLLSN